jgi:hypothetical protein
MTFLCVFALALSLASGRLANRWSDALARTATIRLSAPPEQIEARPRRSWRCCPPRPASPAPAP